MTEGPNNPPPGDANAGATPPATPPPPGGTPPPPSPAAPQGTSGAQVGQPADLGTRILAKVIDGIALSIIFSILYFALILPIFGTRTFFGGRTVSFTTQLFAMALYALIMVAYYAVMEAQMGKTLGKMILNLEVQGPDGKHPTMEQAFKRNGYFAIGVVPLLGGLLSLAAIIYLIITINNSTTNQGWHDEFAGGTKVVRAG